MRQRDGRTGDQAGGADAGDQEVAAIELGHRCISLGGQVFGGVDGGGDESGRVTGEWLESGDGAVGPGADAEQIAGGVDAVARTGLLDDKVLNMGVDVRGRIWVLTEKGISVIETLQGS